MAVYLFAVRDPRGHEVRLAENCYRLHIFIEHPELVDINHIADTITSPDLITQDAVDPQRLAYYRTISGTTATLDEGRRGARRGIPWAG
jgi:hypothetical protein